MTGGAGDIDHTAAPGVGHRLADDLAGNQRAADQVQLVIFHPVVRGNFRKRALRCHCHAGIVSARGIHQHGRDAESLCGGGEEVFDALAVGGVGLDKKRLSAGLRDLGHAGFATLGAASGHHNFGAGGGESEGHASTENTGAADNNSHFFREVEQVRSHRDAD